MDIAAWLRGLGLEEYAPAFRDNRIDAEVLPELTGEDLKDIGIAAVGDRRKLPKPSQHCAWRPRPYLLGSSRRSCPVQRPSLRPSAGN
jgi:hypothetical protein